MATITLDQMVEDEDVNIRSREMILTSEQARDDVSMSDLARDNVKMGRRNMINAIHGVDTRLIVVLGPCSLHDPDSMYKYAQWVRSLEDEFGSQMMFYLRMYPEKPRTKGGDWQGYLIDPYMDQSFQSEQGILDVRDLMNKINELGVPIFTEFLELDDLDYLGDGISGGAIGARNVGSQPHAIRVSGYPMPVGFKNDNISGDVKTAVNSAHKGRHVNSYRDCGYRIITEGNSGTFIILRGDYSGPNYNSESVDDAQEIIKGVLGDEENLILGDCSHDQTIDPETGQKDYTRQVLAARSFVQQRVDGNRHIFGIMLETYHKDGNQKWKYKQGVKPELDPYVSITDACMGREITYDLLQELKGMIS